MNPPVIDPCLYCLARHGCAFSRLGEAERHRLQAVVTTKSFARGVSLVHQGEAAGGVYVVQAGVVRLQHVTSAGRTAIAKVLGPGGMVGLVEVLSGRSHLMSAETLEASRLEYLSREDFFDFLDTYPRAAVGLLARVAWELHETLQEGCEFLSKSPLPARLWHNLRDLCEVCGLETEEGVALSRHLTVQDLAHGLGCSRQWASKLLGELQEQGLVKRRGRQIILTPSGVESRRPGRPFLSTT